MSWLAEKPHRRRNLLSGEWVLVSPHRAKRPWQGQVEKPVVKELPSYDPTCYLCPGNERAGGVRNPQYESCFVFDNDFAALYPSEGGSSDSQWFEAEAAGGICRVLCFSPQHSLTLAQLGPAAMAEVVKTWQEQTAELFGRSEIASVQVFENRGAMMGSSNPHPHGQIWATDFIPQEVEKECGSQEKRPGLLAAYLAEEEKAEERIVLTEGEWVALVPFWAVWPFETLVAPRQRRGRLTDLSAEEARDLGRILQKLTAIYDALFAVSFPYTMGFHQAPRGHEAQFHVHAHFYPPLLRSAEVKKFMVGFEMLAMPQRDITAESAAERLRAVRDSLYGR